MSQADILIAGPCVLESEALVFEVAEALSKIQKESCFELVFKSSFDKANRTSLQSFRGMGLKESLPIFKALKEKFGFRVLTDVHETAQVEALSGVIDVIQVPAMLCRQTDLIAACVKNFKAVNIKRGQFLSPSETLKLYEKAKSLNPDCAVYITERGSSFGYNYLVNDFKTVRLFLEAGLPMVYDATHSVQLPGGMGDSSGGEGRLAPRMAYAAASVGVRSFFFETHPNPKVALSDGPNMVPLSQMGAVVRHLEACVKLSEGAPSA